MNKGFIVIAGIVVLVLGLIAFYWFEVHAPGVSTEAEVAVEVTPEPVATAEPEQELEAPPMVVEEKLPAISPELDAWEKEGDETREAVCRHMGYFNANPILASYILGVVVNMERRRRSGEGVDSARIERIKGTLSAVLTAKGDYFFSVVLLPLGLTIACIFAMYSSYLGPVIFLALYNYFHLQARIGGYLIGVRLGEGLGNEYVRHIFREQAFLGGCAAFGAGVFTALGLVRAGSYGGLRLSGWGIAAAVAFLVLRRKMSIAWSVMVVFIASAAYLLLI